MSTFFLSLSSVGSRSGRHGACTLSGAVLAAMLLPAGLACAQATSSSETSSLDDHVALNGHSLNERVQVRPSARLSVTQSAAQPLATAGQSGAVGNWYGRDALARQTMVWGQPFAARGLRVGLGVEQRGAAIGGGLYQTPYQGWRAGASGDTGLLVGLAMPTGPRSHVFLQTPLVEGQPTGYDDFNLSGRDPAASARQVRVGMVFNSKKAYADIRKGLRMELSGQSSLTFRPRGGGRVGVTFQKIW
ncbi:hypothetical protein [Roseateles amylovorans]|uniref:Lipoprotein n=1 Tax=Roseateles amylovorans TaxID=2978473 RepID=A0ABY6AU26_9BURK|nr:hypothetical protein [Roseateles amylovorans]UXH76726.1 hypothetical protein N4261_16995 [Roseateles amylovorans]